MSKSRRERLDHLPGRAIEVFRCEGWKLSRLADQHATERDHLLAHDAEREAATQVVERGPNVGGGDANRELLVQLARERLGERDDVRDDLREERALVRVVVVHG